MKNLIIATAIILCGTSVLADEITNTVNQEIVNTKGFLGVNYDRQDIDGLAVQKITNDHSFFNINIQIIKKGALFNKTDNNVDKAGN